MNRQEAEHNFAEFLSLFDMHDGMMRLKRDHSYRVAGICAGIAQRLDLSSADQDLAYRIGLVHDIGRFEQARKFHSFLDYQTMDHGDYGAALLKENDTVLSYADATEASVLITAVRNHNKYRIEEGLDERTLLFARIIRDADKIDILYLRSLTSYDGLMNLDRNAIENSFISTSVYEEVMRNHTIVSSARKTPLDRVVSIACFVFDMNWDSSFIPVLENQYLEKLFSLYRFRNPETVRQVKEVQDHCIAFMKKRMEKGL